MDLGHRLISYYHYIVKGKSKYYLHSPFLYDFKLNILENKDLPGKYTAEHIYSEYLKNDALLQLNGSGSKNNKQGRVKDIAANYSLHKKYGRMLSRLATFSHSKNMIELGTALGVSTAYLAQTNEANVVTFEAEPNFVELAKQAHQLAGLNNIRYTEGNIDDTLPAFLSSYSEFDLAFVDANHTYAATMNYFKQLLPHTHSQSIIVFDDIHWSEEMTRAWKEIINHSSVTLSIDLYRMGIIFFNPGLSKENFSVWY